MSGFSGKICCTQVRIGDAVCFCSRSGACEMFCHLQSFFSAFDASWLICCFPTKSLLVPGDDRDEWLVLDGLLNW